MIVPATGHKQQFSFSLFSAEEEEMRVKKMVHITLGALAYLVAN